MRYRTEPRFILYSGSIKNIAVWKGEAVMNCYSDVMEKAKAASNAEEFLALAAENGITLSPEEAERYFTLLNQEKDGSPDGCELADEELDNVAGGSSCVGGRTYSDEWPYCLITTAFNSCSHWKLSQDYTINARWCEECQWSVKKGAVLYCMSRTRGNDPYK